jgi:hypothetical protein
MALADLKNDLIAFAGVEAEQQIPLAIRMAEGEMNRRVRCRQMVGRATINIATALLSVPADFMGARSLELGSSPPIALEYAEPDRLTQLVGLHTTAGAPVYYSVLGDVFRFCPAPAAAYGASALTYWKALSALSDGNTSNWLLDAWPDAYLYGALKHLGRLLVDPRAQTWSAAFDTIVAEMNLGQAR